MPPVTLADAENREVPENLVDEVWKEPKDQQGQLEVQEILVHQDHSESGEDQAAEERQERRVQQVPGDHLEPEVILAQLGGQE